MAFFESWMNTARKLTHPVVQSEQKQNKEREVETEDEASTYAQAFLKCLTTLDAELHGLTDPQEVGLKALSAACEFYDADWCGVLDVDMKLELWMPFWWYNRNTGGMTTTKIGENGIAGFYTRWEEALERNECICVPDVEAIKDVHPEEYEIFSTMDTKSLLAVPYRKRESGFMLLRNPKRYVDKPDILRILSFILVAEITEQKLVERMKMSASTKQITEDSDIYDYDSNGYARLCVYYPRLKEWNSNMYLAESFVPWVITWLSAYEYWQITGLWLYPESKDAKPKG